MDLCVKKVAQNTNSVWYPMPYTHETWRFLIAYPLQLKESALFEVKQYLENKNNCCQGLNHSLKSWKARFLFSIENNIISCKRVQDFWWVILPSSSSIPTCSTRGTVQSSDTLTLQYVNFQTQILLKLNKENLFKIFRNNFYYPLQSKLPLLQSNPVKLL